MTLKKFFFPVKDKIDFQHQNNVANYGKCPNPNFKDDYIGETHRRVIERVIDYNKWDKKSHMLKHSRDKLHTDVWEHDFKLLGNNYQSNIKRKISESLFIRQLKPSLNKQDKPIPLNLCSWFLIVINTYIDNFWFQILNF